MAKDAIVIADKKLETLCSAHETMKIKSGAWEERGIFIYSTMSHIKYLLPNGDRGIVRTLDTPIYITAVKDGKVYCLDREIRNRVISIDTTEYTFKYALVNNKFNEVLSMVKNSNLIGQSVISYLEKKGFPEVALYFVKDPRTRFKLALECGSLEIALDAAKKLDDKECWLKIGNEALRQGHHQIVETAYQKIGQFERLSFLYLLTGNNNNLNKMLKIAVKRNDVNSQFHNALLLGDVEARVRLLEEVGQLRLAHLTAVTHGLVERAQGIAEKITLQKKEASTAEDSEPEEVNLPGPLPNAKLLYPAVPIMRLLDTNWPLLTKKRGKFDQMLHEQGKLIETEPADDDEEGQTPWEPDVVIGNDEDNENEEWKRGLVDQANDKSENGEGEAGEWEPDIDIPDVGEASNTTSAKESYVKIPQPGSSAAQLWCVNSNLPADHAAAGSFESTMRLLNQQIGVVNFAPLKPYFLKLYMSSRLQMPGLPSLNSLTTHLHRNWENSNRNTLPLLPLDLASQFEKLQQQGYAATTKGKFSEALSAFQSIMCTIPFVVVESRTEVNDIKDLITNCREYIIGMIMELQRKGLQDAVRVAELAAYFTHCNLQAAHLLLCLRSAVNMVLKLDNFGTAHTFASRMLDMNPAPNVLAWVKKVMRHCEQNQLKDTVKLNYDARNPFVICGASLVPIYKGHDVVKCPYCGQTYLPAHKGKVCNVCQIAQIGKEVSGIQAFSSRAGLSK
eukprot:TRINITY_DN5413_c0_g2_i3.p1 TRINITY_DN5413_c0_g2~~TRINITY_DN5413_c0_g2_i3.p1  ORF type:complete len:732 (-),score=145.80 TRINITY_DN5413_c0_g2_i3:27-2222(-)